MMTITATLRAVAAAGNAPGSSDRSEAYMAQLASRDGSTQGLEPSLKENVLKLLPALKQIREKVQDTLIANSKSWEAPNA